MVTKKRDQHVVPLGRGWGVKSAQSSRFTMITSTQKEACSVATGIAKNKKTGVVIHGRDGKIRERNTFAPKKKRK